MIETPLDTLDIRRDTFVKSLYDGIGLSEAALEYLDAYSTVTKMDIYHEPVYNEEALLIIAKQQGEIPVGEYGQTVFDDTAGYENTYVQVPGQNISVEGAGDSGARLALDTKYQSDVRSNQFDNVPHPNSTIEDNHYLQPNNNPLMENILHTFSNGVKGYIPAWYSAMLSYHKVSDDDKYHAGKSRAEYDSGRIAGWLNDGRQRLTTPNVAKMSGHMRGLDNKRNLMTRLNAFEEYTPEQMVEAHYPEVMDGRFTLKDYLHGFEGFGEEQRKQLYDYIEKNGYDWDDRLSEDLGGINGADIRFSLGLRFKPLMDHLVKPGEKASENIHVRPERVAAEHSEIPHHVFDSMSRDHLSVLHRAMYKHLDLSNKNKQWIDDFTKRLIDKFPTMSESDARVNALETDLLRHDMFKYSNKTNEVSMDLINGPIPSDFNQWTQRANPKNLSRSGLYAALNWDNVRRRNFDEGANPIKGYTKDLRLVENFPSDVMTKLENNMKTGKDAIYEGTHMRIHAQPWMKRRVDIEHAGEFMGGDERGFNDIFSRMFQRGGGHHLLPNNALRALAPIFNHNGKNLMFDVEHPESYSRRSILSEDSDEDKYYIGPREEYDRFDEDAKPTASSSKAISWAGQPQLTRFFHKIYDPEEWKDYVQRKAAGENVKKPDARVVGRSTGDIPKAHKSDNPNKQARKKAREMALIEMAQRVEASAHLSQYTSHHHGAARGSGGLNKEVDGYADNVDDAHFNIDHHYENMQRKDTSKKRSKDSTRGVMNEIGRRRLNGQSSEKEGDYESIPHSFIPVGPQAHRKEADGVDQQTRAMASKNFAAFDNFQMTGGLNHPFNPQRLDVLRLDQSEQHHEAISNLLRFHATKDNITDKEGELRRTSKAKSGSVMQRQQKIRDTEETKSYYQKKLKDAMVSGVPYSELNKLQQRYNELDKKSTGYTNGTFKDDGTVETKSLAELQSEDTAAKRNLRNHRKGPQLNKKELTDIVNTILQGKINTPEYQEAVGELEEENRRLKAYKGGFDSKGREERMKKLSADIRATGLMGQDLRSDLDLQGISMGNSPLEVVSNAVVIAFEAERQLHGHKSTGKDDRFQTHSTSIEPDETDLPEQGNVHSGLKDLIRNNGHNFGDIKSGNRLNEFGKNISTMEFDNDRGYISRQMVDRMKEIQDNLSHLSPEDLRETAPHIRQMSVNDLLGVMHPELKGELYGNEPAVKHIHAMRELLHLGPNYEPTEKTEMMENQLGIHFIPPRSGKTGIEAMLDGHIVIDPSVNAKDKLKLDHPSLKNKTTPISNISERGGVGVKCLFTDPSDHFKWSGYRPTIRAVRDHNHNFVKWEQVEPYDYSSRTMPMSMYEQIIPEFVEEWGGSLGKHNTTGFDEPPAMRRLMKKHDTADAALLLASLSDPDIMLKKDGDYPILQPMHRIFKLEDMEHLRGFSGDWIVSAMPEGPRAFVEKKDDKVTVRGDFDLDKETKENFTKISKKDFVVDVVFANKEYNVIDIVEYDDGNVNDMPLQERIKILRGTMESTENVLVPAAHNLRLTDDVGLEIIVKDLLKEHDRLMLRDANSTYMKGEARHPKWVLYDEGRDVNLMVLDKKGTSSYTYRLGTGPITHEDSLGDRAVKYEGDTYMDVGTSFQTKDKYEVGDIVTVNVDSVSVTENVDGADIYTVNSNEIKGEAEGEGVSSVETLSLFTKSEPMMWPHEIDRDGDRIVIKMAAGDVSYRASAIDDEWYMFNPKAENGWLIRLAESQRPFWSPVAGVMLKADLSVIDDETKAEVHESKGDGKPLIPPKKVTGTNFWDDYATDKAKIRRLLAKSLNLVSTMLKSSVGAVGDSSTGAMGMGIDYATPIESPSGPTSLVGSKTLPDHDVRDIERDNKERAEDKKFNHKETPEGELSIERGKAAFVPY